ncbi:MAG: ATP-binding protein [Desulfuromonadales bacterium]
MILTKIKSVIASNVPNPVLYGVIVLFFTMLVSVSGYLLIQRQKQFLLQEKQKEITTIVDIKSSQLVEWRTELFTDGASVRSNAMMTHRLKEYLSGRDQETVRREFRLWMAVLIDLGGYSKGVLYAPDGTLIASDTGRTFPLTPHYQSLVAEAAEGHEIILTDFHFDADGASLDIDLVIPIMDFSSPPHRCIAVLILDIDPAKKVYPMIQSWPTASVSAETLLVKKEGNSVLYMNELRYRPKSSTPFYLPMTDKNLPAVRALSGEEGTFEGYDYRTVPVVSAVRRVPGTQWGLIAKIDASEVYAPLKPFTRYVIMYGALIITAIIMGIYLWGVRRKAVSLRNEVDRQKKAELQLYTVQIELEQQIQHRTSDLTEINTLLRMEMVSRENLEQKLIGAKRLEAIGQIAGGVAHEVRNPLNAILTISEALFREREIESNPEFTPYIQHIRTQVNRLVILMNDLLDLGRSIPAVNMHQLPLEGVCRDAFALWKATGLCRNRFGTYTPGTEDPPVMVVADGQKLQQVIFNLLENAGHHSNEGSPVLLKIVPGAEHHPEGMAVVQIIDSGSGIPEDILPHIFEPFYTGRKGGTGLGLALVKHFIEHMGGSVQIWNNDPPPGCTVEVQIPLYREENQ